MTTIISLYDKNKNTIQVGESSFLAYSKSLKKLGVTTVEELKRLTDIEYIMEKLEKIENTNTRCLAVHSAIFFVKNFLAETFESTGSEAQLESKIFEKKLKQLNEHCLNKRYKDIKENVYKGSERYKNLNIEDLRAIFSEKCEKLLDASDLIPETTFYSLLQSYFLVSLYLFNSPQRNNYLHMLYLKGTQEAELSHTPLFSNSNYLVDHGAHIDVVLNVFKTKKVYKQIRFKLSNMSTLIFFKLKEARQYSETNPRTTLGCYQNGDFILMSSSKKGKMSPYSIVSNTILKNASKLILGHELTCNDYRHLYVVELLNSEDYKEMTVSEREKLATRMGHSFNTQQLYNRV